MTEKKDWDIMIDIETLDTRPSAIILTIGAVCFSPGFQIDKGPEFYEKVYAPEQELLHGRTRCSETEKWWSEQTDKTISEAFSGEVVLKGALYRLVNFIVDNTKPESLRIWAKSPQFDLVILRDALSHFDIPIPWHYRDERDVRTAIMYSLKAEMVEYENKHHALQDAHRQIEQLWWVFRERNM